MNRKSFLYASLIVLSVLAVAGCATRSAPAAPPLSPEMEVVTDAYGGNREVTEVKVSAATELPQERMIIRTVEMEIIVHDTASGLESVRALVAESDGYVANSRSWHEQGVLAAHLVIRVPAGEVDAVLESLRALGRVESEDESSEDVTDDYVDLEARLKTLELAEQELQELLQTRQETGKTEEILEVYRELVNIRSQIEQIKGRMQYLENMTALATISLTLTPDALAQPVVIGGWQPQGTARDAVRALIRTVQFFVEAGIWIILFFVPTLIILAAPFVVLVLIIRAWRRRRRRSADQ